MSKFFPTFALLLAVPLLLAAAVPRAQVEGSASTKSGCCCELDCACELCACETCTPDSCPCAGECCHSGGCELKTTVATSQTEAKSCCATAGQETVAVAATCCCGLECACEVCACESCTPDNCPCGGECCHTDGCKLKK